MTERSSRSRPLRLVALISVIMALASSCAGGGGADGSDRITLERRLASPVSVGFSIERTVFSNGPTQIEAYRTAMTDVIDQCIGFEDRSCRLATFASDAGNLAGRLLPEDRAFRATDGAFYLLDSEETDISLATADAIRLRRGKGYRDAVQADLDAMRDRGCVDPFSGLRSALDALADVDGERHVIVMGSGLWNCPPLDEVLTSEGGRVSHDQAVSDALTMIEPGSAEGVTFHFVRFGETFIGEWVVMTRAETTYIEDIWVDLVEQWGGVLDGLPREELQFP